MITADVRYSDPERDELLDRVERRAAELSHTRRRRRHLGTSLVAIALAVVTGLAIAVPLAVTTGDSRGPAPLLPPPDRGAPIVVDTALTPKGWVPVDYAGVQVSVPADWTLLSGSLSCTGSRGAGTVDLGPVPVDCRSTSFVRMSTNGAPHGWVRSRLNGLTVTEPWCPPRGPRGYCRRSALYVPALRVELKVKGSPGWRIARTLTYSPRQAVLDDGPVQAPGSWSSHEFDGLRFAVPVGVSVTTSDEYGPGCGLWPLQGGGGVWLSTDQRLEVPGCPIIGRVQVRGAEQTGPLLGIDASAGQFADFMRGDSVSRRCFDLNDVRACPYTSPVLGQLWLQVTAPGIAQPMLVRIQLMGQGTQARQILGSLRPASAG